MSPTFYLSNKSILFQPLEELGNLPKVTRCLSLAIRLEYNSPGSQSSIILLVNKFLKSIKQLKNVYSLWTPLQIRNKESFDHFYSGPNSKQPLRNPALLREKRH